MRYIIVGYDRNRAIGALGTLPWEGHLKTDMRFVREHTTGNAIIMGRKTFESIGRALPNRQNIVITHSPTETTDATFVSTIDDAYATIEPGRDAYIFGGGQIYSMAVDTVDQIFATEIDTKIENADAFFPKLDKSWVETSREHHAADDDNMYSFDFVTYKKTQN